MRFDREKLFSLIRNFWASLGAGCDSENLVVVVGERWCLGGGGGDWGGLVGFCGDLEVGEVS